MNNSRLALGTAQFGLDYGITNTSGRVTPDEVREILKIASEGGIDTLDTAHLYGGSESAIGDAAPSSAEFKIVTKTPKFNIFSSATKAASALHAAFDSSLAKLGRSAVYGLLLHSVADLLGPFGERLWRELEVLKCSRRVARIGVSVYEGADIDEALRRYPLEIVQLPWNPLDDRLVEGGQLERLAAAGSEVHARSLFLQGLLLQPVTKIPERFAPVANAVAALDATFTCAGLERLEGIFAAAFARPEIDRFVVGVTTRDELKAILLAATRAHGVEDILQIPTCPGLDPRYLNPARWSEFA